jgi:hypothetical protein
VTDQEKLREIYTRYQWPITGEIRISPIKPLPDSPGCEWDWIVEDQSGQRYLIPTQCDLCKVGGLEDLQGVRDPSRVIDIFLDYLKAEGIGA